MTVQHFEASPSLQDVSACHLVAAQLCSLLDVSLEPAISKCEIHHRSVCATWAAAEFERLHSKRSTIKRGLEDRQGGGSGNRVGIRIIVIWKGGGLFATSSTTCPYALGQPSFRALTRGYTLPSLQTECASVVKIPAFVSRRDRSAS